MEIQQLRHLIAAIQYGNLLKAAQVSNISQSGLSRSIKSLETRLGVPLLVRKSKGVEPTVFGLCLIRRAQVIISEAAHSVREIKAIEQAEAGEVSIGITAQYAHHLIPKLIAELITERPGVHVTVRVGAFADLMELLNRGEIDFAFGRLGPIEQNPDLAVEELRESHARVLVRASHPLLSRGAVGIEDLSRARWAMLTGAEFQRNFQNFFYVRGQTIPAQAVTTDSIAMLKHVIIASDLLTILPEEAAGEEIAKGALNALRCETPAEFARVGFLFRTESLMTPQMQLLTERIRAAITGNVVALPSAAAR